MTALEFLAALHLSRRGVRPHAPTGARSIAVDSLWPSATGAHPSRGRELLRVLALGVQVYRVESDRDGRLVLRAAGPRADLFDDLGRKRGTLYVDHAAPVWELGTERVVGRKTRERPSPSDDSFPELQLASTPSGTGGALHGTTLVERIGAVGGAEPPIESSMHVGDTVESAYCAEYVFYASPD